MTKKTASSILIAVCIAGAYAFHRGADNFWGVIVCGLVALWALFSMLPVMDSSWRLKVGSTCCRRFTSSGVKRRYSPGWTSNSSGP